MKTIYCSREITINVNGIDYTFEENTFVQKCEIERMQEKKELWYKKGGRCLSIEPIPDKLANWFKNVAQLNEEYGYYLIDIK